MPLKVIKAYKGVGMESFIAKWYAKITLRDMALYKMLTKEVAENLATGSSVLDLASGPGYLAIELAKLGGYKVTGLDISKTFAEIAHKKAKEAGVAVEFLQGDAANMPFTDESFDFIICRAAFKNFRYPIGVLDEMYRVLKSNRKALIVDLRRDASKKAIYEYINNMGLSWIDSIIIKLAFKFSLMKRVYLKDDFNNFLTRAKFRECEISETPLVLEISILK